MSKNKVTMFKAVLIMFSSMVLSRVVGFARNVVLANVAGASVDADAYAFSFLIPDLLNQFLAGAVLSTTFIPLFQSLKTDRERSELFSNIFWIGTTLFVLGISLSYIFTPHILHLVAGNNITNPQAFSLTVHLTRIILPAQLFFFWGAILNGILYANHSFRIPSLAGPIYNIGIIAGGLFLSPRIGIEGFAWGVVGGAFLGNVLMQIFAIRAFNVKLIAVYNPFNKNFKEWFIKTIPLIFTVGLAYSNELMGRIFGSRSPEGSGALSAINYAYRVYMIPVGLFGQSFASGIYPFLTQKANDKDYSSMEDIVFKTIERIALFTFTVSILFFILRTDIITLLYKRGAFDSDATKLTATAFASYLPGMFFFASSLVLNRLFFSLRETTKTLFISLLVISITIPIYATIGISLGIKGIGLTSSLGSLINFALLLLFWKRKYKSSKVNDFLLNIVKTALFTFLITLPAVIIGHYYQIKSGAINIIIRSGVVSFIPLFSLLLYTKKDTVAAFIKRRGHNG